ncbi:hypothetical protein NKH36_03020 [Mesorhizobium sp. M1312]|uniref:hypothetical protein n=1 Tax=unclassified Mesorhizobium TaxID=325217 RepID=UPI00333D1921
MSTRQTHLNKDAIAPTGLPTLARFRLVPPGGVRLNADSVTIEAGEVNEFVNMIDGGLYGAPSNMNYAIVEAVNGVNVAKFDPTLAATPTGYSLNNLGFGALNTGQYTFAGLWKVTDAFVGAKPREILAAAFNGASGRAALREDASGAPQARAQRTASDAVTIVSIFSPVRIGGWVAAAGVYDWTNNLVTIHDLLGTESVSAAITGTPGAAPSDINAYRLGYFASATERFVGQLADYIHLPYIPSDPELMALKIHMQARATDLAA